MTLFLLLSIIGIILPSAVSLSIDPLLIWTWVVANSIVALSYFSIPISLFFLVRSKTKSSPFFQELCVLFATFIFMCGCTHVMDIVIIWWPLYWLYIAVASVTAFVSAYAAIWVLAHIKIAAVAVNTPAISRKLAHIHNEFVKLLDELRKESEKNR